MHYPLTESVLDIATRVRLFVDDVVVPAEAHLRWDSHGLPEHVRLALQDRAREAGVFAPTAPARYDGGGLSHQEQALILEESGRSLIGPLAMNCAAPDEGNMLLLDKVASPDQQARYLEPLCRGEVRSAFAMTEPPPGAGSDPDMLATTADGAADGWTINGLKWFITGAVGATFLIVMARTDHGATMFLVDCDNPGMTVERSLDTLDGSFSGGHCVVRFDDCRVDQTAVLGAVGQGFPLAQLRLGPARLTHCMRWLGAARRAHETAVEYASSRQMFGTTLGSLGMAQQAIADNEIDIAASRALIRHAAWSLDEGMPARQETSIAKTFVAEAVFRVVDRSMQLCGSTAINADSPIPRIFRDIRPFRIYDGPSEVHRWSIARRAVRRVMNGGMAGDWK